MKARIEPETLPLFCRGRAVGQMARSEYSLLVARGELRATGSRKRLFALHYATEPPEPEIAIRLTKPSKTHRLEQVRNSHIWQHSWRCSMWPRTVAMRAE